MTPLVEAGLGGAARRRLSRALVVAAAPAAALDLAATFAMWHGRGYTKSDT